MSSSRMSQIKYKLKKDKNSKRKIVREIKILKER